MLRLARHFGFDSYQQFREPFQNRLRVRRRGYLARARDLQAKSGNGEGRLTQEVLEANLGNLRETFEINPPERFEAAAKALTRANRVFVVGMRGVYPVAFFFHYAYSMFRDNAILLENRGGAFADELRNFGKKDAVFAVSFSPYTVETVRTVDYAKEMGGMVVAMTDSPVSPLAKGADHVLIVKNESPSFYHSVAAGVTAAEELIALLMAEGGADALRAIGESERQLDKFHAYWNHKVDGRQTRSAHWRPAKSGKISI